MSDYCTVGQAVTSKSEIIPCWGPQTSWWWSESCSWARGCCWWTPGLSSTAPRHSPTETNIINHHNVPGQCIIYTRNEINQKQNDVKDKPFFFFTCGGTQTLTSLRPPYLSMFNREWMWLSLVKYSRVLTNRSGDDTPNEYLKYTQQTYNAEKERWQTLWTNYCKCLLVCTVHANQGCKYSSQTFCLNSDFNLKIRKILCHFNLPKALFLQHTWKKMSHIIYLKSSSQQ